MRVLTVYTVRAQCTEEFTYSVQFSRRGIVRTVICRAYRQQCVICSSGARGALVQCGTRAPPVLDFAPTIYNARSQ